MCGGGDEEECPHMVTIWRSGNDELNYGARGRDERDLECRWKVYKEEDVNLTWTVVRLLLVVVSTRRILLSIM